MFLQWLESQFEMPVFIYLFIIFLSVMMRICALIEIEFFILMPWFKGTWSYSYLWSLWSIIDGKIVESCFLECILVFLREDGDDLRLILQTKLFQKETLMVVHVQHLVKQFGLPDATEQRSLFRLWLCDNCILQVSQREQKTHFQILFEPPSSIKDGAHCCYPAHFLRMPR